MIQLKQVAPDQGRSQLGDPRRQKAGLHSAFGSLMAVAAMALAAAAPAAQAQCPVSFAAAANYGAGTFPLDAAIGDLDGDGMPDLAAANYLSANVSVLLSNGAGAFAAATNYGTGTNPLSVAIGDVNGDGRPDLAVANQGSNNISVLLGDGDGAFAAAVNYGAGGNPGSVAIGDLDGDGAPDLAVANRNSNNVSVLLGNGDGTFAPGVNYAAGSLPSSVGIADLNSDGAPDLAVANDGSANVSVLLGNGDGTFAAAVSYGAGVGPQSVAIGDVNGDGAPDLAVANINSNNVSVLLGNGDGTFAATVNYAAGTSPLSVVIGDLNADGKPDLAVANYNSNSVSALVGNGDGAFAAAVNYGSGARPNSIAIGDLNGDGKPDLALASDTSNAVSVLLNDDLSIGINPQPMSQSVVAGDNVVFTATATGTGPFTYQWRRDGLPIIGATTGTLTINNVTVANVGSYDVQVRGGCNPTAVATSYPATLCVSPPSCTLDVTLQPVSQAVAEGDTAIFSAAASGDGTLTLQWRRNGVPLVEGAPYSGVNTDTLTIMDVIPADAGAYDLNVTSDCVPTPEATSDLAVLSVTPASCQLSFAAKVNHATGNGAHSVAVGDLNGDGKPDLAVANAAVGNVSVLMNNGGGAFAAPVNYVPFFNPRSVAVGDLNADGNPDLAVGNLDIHSVAVLLGDGDGNLATAVNYGTGFNPLYVAIGDLNGDGWPDLVTANLAGNASVLLGNGAGGFAATVNYATGNSSTCVAIGDLNGDGWPDLSVTNQFSDDVSVLLNNGAGAFAAAVNYGGGGSRPLSVAIGDLNADGLPDLAVANSGSGAPNASVLLGNGDGTFAAAVNYVAGAEPHAVAIADLNGDGRADLAVASDFNDNFVSILLGDGNGNLAAAGNYSTGFSPFSMAIGDFDGDGRPDLATANFGGDNVSVLLNDGSSIGILPPLTQVAMEGDTVMFSTIVDGDGSLTLQWRRDGAPLLDGGPYSGVHTDTLTITDVMQADEGAYDLRVNAGGDSCNPFAVATSNPAALSVIMPDCPLDVTLQPISQLVAEGATLMFSSAASGTGTLTLQWRHNGVPLVEGAPYSGVNTDTLTITDAMPVDGGAYDLRVTSDCSSEAIATSDPAGLCVASAAACPGDVNGDNVVDLSDLALMLSVYNTSCAP